jgi:uncharacterized protein YgiM (DUF1202 family)
VPETANVRKSPAADAEAVTRLTKGEKFYAIKFAHGWAGGKTDTGKWGWIREDLLQFSSDQGHKLAAATGHGSSSSSSSSDPVHHPVAWVAVADANVRSGPGLGFDKYGSLNRGDKLYILERRGEWLRCKTPGGSGWLSDCVVTSDAGIGRHLAHGAPDPPKAYIDGDVVSLRRAPSVNADLISRVRGGQTVWVLERHPDWAKIKINNGCTGWVARDYLKAPDSAAAAAPSGPPSFPSATKGHRFNTLTAWIDGDNCNVRDSAGTDGEVKFQLSQGDRVAVTSMDGQWCKIKTGEGRVGWVAGWQMDFAAPGKTFTKEVDGHREEARIGWVSRPSVNLRSGAGENYPRIGTLGLSTQVIIVSQQGDWYKVAMDNREIGWVGSWMIDTQGKLNAREPAGCSGIENTCPTPLARAPGSGDFGGSGAGGEIARSAMRHLGEPYVYGDIGPHSFDCSGLVCYVLQQHGIAAGRTSSDLFHQGQPVSRDDLEPGDVVFFAGTYRAGISHVGLYIGGGRMVHAANPGRGVTIDGLDERYYAEKYVGARRMR